MLTYSDTNAGFTPEYLAGFAEQSLSAKQALSAKDQAGELPFTLLPTFDDTGEIIAFANDIAAQFSTVVVLGIGGSDLGARAAHRALNHQFYNYDLGLRNGRPRLFFAGDTTDPVALQEVLDLLDWNTTAILVISKSGETIEIMSSFLVLRERLIAAVGAEHAKTHIFSITDPATGTFREVVNREGYKSLPHGMVGGRFSVLSNVGLLPLAIAGIDIAAMRAGAANVHTHPEDAERWALQQYLSYTERGEHISVLMPYTYALREVGFWFRQLWAESLGKNEEVGPTPIAAIGPTDQHSQAQLYMAGPKDKFVTFISVEEGLSTSVPREFTDLESVKHVAGHDMRHILQAELQGTAQALTENGRHSGLITLTKLDAEHIGALFFFFEMATAYTAELFQVNAYDQPGVQRGKELAHHILAEH